MYYNYLYKKIQKINGGREDEKMVSVYIDVWDALYAGWV